MAVTDTDQRPRHTVVEPAPLLDGEATTTPQAGRTDWLIRVILPYLALLAAAAVLVRQSLRPLSNSDTWFHLRAGEEILRHWNLANPQPWTPFEHPSGWTLTQWLPEVVATSADHVFGLSGVAWLWALGMLLLLVCVYLTCRARATPLPAALVAATSVVAMAPTLSARPQLISFILLSVFTFAWLRTAQDLKARWWLVPMSWVWACCHGMWVSGIIVGLAVCAGLALDPATRRRAGRLALVPLMGAAVTALTPIGPRLLLSPFEVGKVTGYISEWGPPSFRDPAPMAAALMLAVVAISWMRRAEVAWPKLFVLAVAGGWLLLSGRTVTLAAIMTAPLLAEVLQSWLPHDRSRITRREQSVVALGLVVSLAVAALLLAVQPARAGGVPLGLDTTLTALPRGTVVLNDSGGGGWLDWRYPQVDPVMDGRIDAYEPAYIDRYLSALSVEQGWERFVTSTRATAALLPEHSPLATALQQRLNWTVTGNDAGFVLLVAPQA